MKTTTLLLAFLLTATVALGQGVKIGASMVVEPGTTVHANTNLDVNAGEVLLKPNATLIMGDGKTLSINNGGAIKALGNETNQSIVTSTGYFVFIVSDGGSISASHATFEKMSGSGLNIHSGAVVDPDHPLSHCTFQNGSNGSTLLTINNNQYLTIEGAMFVSSPDLELHNVAKALNQGIVNFINYGGNFAGEDFEDDNFNRIFWGATAPFQELATGTVGHGVVLCFDALDVITVENLLVQNGGIIDLVAGQRILLLPGVLVQSGGQLHAWISTDGIFCNPLPLVASKDSWPEPADKQPIYSDSGTGFKLYPNPTTSLLNIELIGEELIGETTVQIYGNRGEMLQQICYPELHRYTLDLTVYPPGIYLVRIMHGTRIHVGRVIKN